MGADRKGTPLPLDIGKCMQYASKESYGLEITGTRSQSCSWDQNVEQEEDLNSIIDVEVSIQRQECLLRTHGSLLPDKGEKIKKRLKGLYKREELLKQQALGVSTLAKEGEQYTTEDNGDEFTYSRNAGKGPAALSCTYKQMANHHGHEQGTASAFCEAIGDFKVVCNNGNTNSGLLEGSSKVQVPPGGMRSRGQKGNSSITVSSSSFYTSSRDIPLGSKGLENVKHSIQAQSFIASRVASGKRHRAFSPHRKDRNSSLETSSPGFARGRRKATNDEPASSQKNRPVSEPYMHKDSLGASMDTAMELSDDEEKRGIEDVKADAQQKDILTHPYSLRSSPVRTDGFSLTYPSGDPEAVEVQRSDLKHLDPHEFLNDTVIDFYIKYLQRPEFLCQEKKAHFHFFNTFFFKKLLLEKRKRKKGDSYYSKLRKWTKGVNIFEKKYLLVPVHDSAHWSLAIICFAIDHQEGDGLTPYILHLDSMREGHVSEEIFLVLRRYLEAEWNHMRDLDVNDKTCTPALRDFVCKRIEVPLQQNAWDCGLFLLFFIECFLRDANSIFKPHSLDSMFGSQWFKPQEASNLRKRIRFLLENLIQKLNDEIMMEDMD